MSVSSKACKNCKHQTDNKIHYPILHHTMQICHMLHGTQLMLCKRKTVGPDFISDNTISIMW